MSCFITLTGRVGKKHELTSAGSSQLLRFSVANGYKQRNEERTDWYSVSLFGKLAEYIDPKLTVGCKVLCIGRLETLDNQKSGDKMLTINATHVEIMSPGKAPADPEGPQMKQLKELVKTEDVDWETPF